jgi:uncharacterized protein YcbX
MEPKIVSEIWIYPVKSLGGIRLLSARVLHKGLAFDRRWMLVDEEGIFMTQRIFPELSLFKLSVNNAIFSITYREEQIELLPGIEEGPGYAASIWEDRVQVKEVSKKHSEWFSERLGKRCRLVVFPETNTRQIDPVYALDEEQVSLADGYPLLAIGQVSLDDLNSRLTEKLPMNRFRPNIVFTGGEAYEEDGWKNFSIGNNRFIAVKPCSRCVLTTVDQETGNKGKEPLTTLSTYRRHNGKVYFGQNIIPVDTGVISVGESISVIDFRTPFPAD